ncbi:MAG: SPFH domain-containing protein [Clostridiales bacterium]|nr:SPFH domain-containing protein [Clostridiales bacterium]
MEAFLENLVNHWYWLPIGLVILIVLVKFLPRYKIAPPDTALIISGLLRRRYKVRNMDGSASVKRFGYRIVRGGATFWIPAIERIDKLDMCLMQVDIKTAQPVPTKEYISVLVDAVANIKIGSDELFIATAAEQLLHYDAQQIKALAKDVLEGNMREIIGQMTIAELVQNRDKFAQESIKAAMADMANMGLEIINLTIQNFADKDGNVIEIMAQQKLVEKERDAKIARAKAEQEGHKAQIEAEAVIAEQNKELALREAAYKIEADQEKAKADETYRIEQERIRKTYETERAAAEMTKLQKETELKKQLVEIERERLNVEIREKANAEKDARIARAEAERFERQAKADAELYESQKAAEATALKGRAEAEAIQRKAEAMQQYGQAAMLEMVVDKLPEVARAIGEPLSQTDKIILFGEGAATGLTRDMTGSMMQSFEAIKAATSLDIPQMLKMVAAGGLVGRQVAPEAEKAEAVDNAPEN